MEQKLSNQALAESLVWGFYHRPSFSKDYQVEAEKDYREYRADDETRWVRIFDKVNEFGSILNVTFIPHPISGEFTIIIDTDAKCWDNDRDNEMFHENMHKQLISSIRTEAGEYIDIAGTDYFTILIKENY